MTKASNRLIEDYNGLRTDIERYQHHYYVLDDPLVPDAEFDRLELHLAALDLAGRLRDEAHDGSCGHALAGA